MEAPRHTLATRVAWVDTDAGGRIHFTAVFHWAEAAETALFRSLGLLDDAAEAFGDYPRRSVHAEYIAVLRFGDEIRLELGIERLGHTSIDYAWEIVRDGELSVRGKHTVVHVDAEGKPAPLPERVREALEG